MKTQSGKAKGRKLQYFVRDQIMKIFGLKSSDVWSRAMGSQGEDIILSTKGREKCPLSIECKARKSFKTIYDMYDQSHSNADDNIAVLVIKQDRREPLAIVNVQTFLRLVNSNNTTKNIL